MAQGGKLSSEGLLILTDGPRRPYRLTAFGATALAVDLDALRKVTTTAARRLAIR